MGHSTATEDRCKGDSVAPPCLGYKRRVDFVCQRV